jgi:hypothetical protein
VTDDPLDTNDDGMAVPEDAGTDQTSLPKTRSCEDLHKATDHANQGPVLMKTRRLSDPHIATDPNSLLQSTDSMEPNVEKYGDSARIGEAVCNDLPVSNTISSETLTEVNGVISEGLDHQVTANNQQTHSDCAQLVSTDSYNKDDKDDASEFRIAVVDSPHDTSSPDIAQLDLQENGLIDRASGSTDTLTGEGAGCYPEKQTCHSVIPVVGEKISLPSQSHGAIITADNKSSSAVQNGHSLLVNGQSKVFVTGKISKNHGHHRDNHLGHNGQVANEINSQFRLDDVLSKLELDNLLDGAPLLREGDEFSRLACCTSREGLSGLEETGSVSSYPCRTSNCSTGPPTPGTDIKVKY